MAVIGESALKRHQIVTIAPPCGYIFSYDGENFEKLQEKTTHMHGYTRIGNYKGDPFIVGNYWPQENAETEIMNYQTGQGSHIVYGP